MNTITVEKVKKACLEAKKEGDLVYVVEERGMPSLWVNSADAYNGISIGTAIIQVLHPTDVLEYNNFTRSRQGYTYYCSVEELIEELNEEYGD